MSLLFLSMGAKFDHIARFFDDSLIWRMHEAEDSISKVLYSYDYWQGENKMNRNEEKKIG